MMFILFCLTSVHAQNNTSLELKIDSVNTALKRLRADYDYLKCEYQLSTLKLNINVFINELKIATDQIITNGYNNNYKDELYEGFKMNHEESLKSYESYKTLFWSTNSLVTTIIENQDFIDNSIFYKQQVKLLQDIASTIEQGLKTAKVNLDYQKEVLGLYKRLKNL